MNKAVPLVTVHEDLGWAITRKRPLAPAGRTVVCLLGDGQFVQAANQGPFFKFRRQYDVDISQHLDTEQLELPARDDAFRFQGTMDLLWGVTDPIQVVTRNVDDGLGLVRSTLLQRMWTISRQYQVEQCANANAEINRQLGGSPLALPEGITVHRFSVRLTLDEQTRNYLQQQRNHGYESAHTMRQLQLTERALAGENGLLVMHLTNHREDTASIIQMLANDRTTNENRRIELIRELIDKGFIQDADLDAFTRSLVQQGTAALAAPSGAPQFGALTSSPHTGGVVPGAVAQPTPIAAPQFTPTSQVATPPAPAETQQSTSDENKRSGGVAEWTRVGKNKSQ